MYTESRRPWSFAIISTWLTFHDPRSNPLVVCFKKRIICDSSSGKKGGLQWAGTTKRRSSPSKCTFIYAWKYRYLLFITDIYLLQIFIVHLCMKVQILLRRYLQQAAFWNDDWGPRLKFKKFALEKNFKYTKYIYNLIEFCKEYRRTRRLNK